MSLCNNYSLCLACLRLYYALFVFHKTREQYPNEDIKLPPLQSSATAKCSGPLVLELRGADQTGCIFLLKVLVKDACSQITSLDFGLGTVMKIIFLFLLIKLESLTVLEFFFLYIILYLYRLKTKELIPINILGNLTMYFH